MTKSEASTERVALSPEVQFPLQVTMVELALMPVREILLLFTMTFSLQQLKETVSKPWFLTIIKAKRRKSN
jgi:hypothetical protein